VDRAEWLETVRRRKVERFDTLHAPDYDEHWGAVPATHADYVARLVAATPPGGRVLDAACGTGRFFPQLIAAGLRVEGVDASAAMLANAARKHPDVPTRVAGLRTLAVDAPYDAVMCVDALENLPPEDWPAAIAALRAAARDGAPVYLTVERADADDIARLNGEAADAGLPVVDGEMADTDGGYHYYPPRTRVRDWLAEAGLDVVDEADGDDYWHLLCRAAPHSTPDPTTRRTPTATSRRRRRRPSIASLAVGTGAGMAGAVVLLLVAGAFGAAGVVVTAAVEALVVYVLYRWSPTP